MNSYQIYSKLSVELSQTTGLLGTGPNLGEALLHLTTHFPANFSCSMTSALFDGHGLPGRYGSGLSVFVHSHHGEETAIHMTNRAGADFLGDDLDTNFHGRSPRVIHGGQKGDQFSHVDWLPEHHLIHVEGDHIPSRITTRAGICRLVQQFEDGSAMNIAGEISRVRCHQHRHGKLVRREFHSHDNNIYQFICSPNFAMNNSSQVIRAFTPTGKLRASINLGNPILANRDPASGDPLGVSIDLARAFAGRLGVEVEWVVFDTAGKSVDAVTHEQADIGFFAIDPLRGEGISFTAPYVLIEGSYMVPDASPIQANDEVDRPGRRVTVGKGSAYDLFLSRELRHAEIVRAPTSPTVVDVFVAQGLDVAAGVKQQLEADAKRFPGLRLLPGHFMVIQQAMGLPKGRGEEAAQCLRQFVEDMKASGFVAQALARHGIQGAIVAPVTQG